MAEKNKKQTQEESREQVQLQGGTYEVIRNRLETHGRDLRERLGKLNTARKEVFGAVENKLIASERISTQNNCVPRDMVPVGDYFIFGYNVFIGLRTETTLADIFAVYRFKDAQFVECSLDLLSDSQFQADIKNLYKYYRHTVFVKFAVIGPHLFMVFKTGKEIADVKTFKWLVDEGRLQYVDNRSDHEYVFPPQHGFEWTRTTQDMHRGGSSPHISIEDRIFVETVGGDLTIKVEDNTETGEGVYSEPVSNSDQTLNDAEIYYAVVGNIIILKIRPYQEERFRYILYSEKNRQAVRVDSIKDACVLLPEDHGLVFPKGYYLQTGEIKQFDTNMEDMVFEKRIASPNGEDFLFVFYNRDSGVYVLLSYNLIEQQMAVPVTCSGYSFFEDGTLVYFRANGDAQKHHVIQIWQTPYYGIDYTIEAVRDSELYKIGNKPIVRCMAECMELITLLGKEESYADLYVDIAKKAQDVGDSYFWIDKDHAYDLAEPLAHIRQGAATAVDEFEKVVRTRRSTAGQIDAVAGEVRQIIGGVDYGQLDEIDAFVGHLSELRGVRGKVISMRDLRYADTDTIQALEDEVAEHTDKLSMLCVEFLLDPKSLDPYQASIKAHGSEIENIQTVAQARGLQENVAKTAGELEMLTEIVSNLRIEDATETVAIIDNISLVYSQVNQVKSTLTNRLKELAVVEGQAEFSSQTRLIDQSVINYLDICDTPEKCQEYLTKATVQLETLESRFADFDEFIVTLAEKREEIYNAFESRKVQLVTARNQRASALMTAAKRVLKGIENRVRNFGQVDEINGYFASDLMVERVRDSISRLTELGDSVKAEDIKSQLKTIQQDAIRQLKDRQALYEDGDNIIRLGNHRFSVNHQELEGTIVKRDDRMFYHLTGTGFFEPITDATFLETKDTWDLEIVSESPDVYRSEYLAFKILQSLETDRETSSETILSEPAEALTKRVKEFMGPRYDEGYVKGVHDHDAAKILRALVQLKSEIGLLRYPTQARAMATVFWQLFDDHQAKELLAAKIAGVGHIQRLFVGDSIQAGYIGQLKEKLTKFIVETQLFDGSWIDQACEYLFHELTQGTNFVISNIAARLAESFRSHLKKRKFTEKFAGSVAAVADDPVGQYRLIRDWVISYTEQNGDEQQIAYAGEVATVLMDRTDDRPVVDKSIEVKLADMVGSHGRIGQGSYLLNYCDFMTRLIDHDNSIAPRFRQYQQCKKQLIESYAEELRLGEFKPHVLTTFVRNKLIDKVYLPLIGDNLAKQIGTADESKRTDRQGLLLLISPPGYGKTTLMEYMANRLGLIFMKINGPAIGNDVTSFDPGEVSNAAARQELVKLNLAFEMGDNVMIYVDDIQHTNPEFLQKFISLCDAQRRVEGVYKGKSQTYDLRGKRVCIVMAGNPYTESGEKFRIPDMLSNRADTYNIGDIVGDNYDEFVSSYVENCLTSNPVLQKLANRSQHDVYTVMKLAETGQKEGMEFEGQYSPDELNEYVATMKKLFIVRQVVLRVNQQYIASAGQSDVYRTEPPFLLQGSYRNMNRIASRVLPVMNDEELWTLIHSSYEQDSQTLTTGAESNVLKFRELTECLTEDQAKRWSDIKKTFGRNLLLGGDSEDKVGMIIRQLSAFGAGLGSIKDTIAEGVENVISHRPQQPQVDQAGDKVETVGREVLTRMNEMITAIKDQQRALAVHDEKSTAAHAAKDAQMLVSVLEEQFKTMETWLIPVHHSDADRKAYLEHLLERFETMVSGYNKLIMALRKKYKQVDAEQAKKRRKQQAGKSKPAAKRQDKGPDKKPKPKQQ